MKAKLQNQDILRTNASGDELRTRLPIDVWLGFNVHLIGLSKGILTVAPLYEMSEVFVRKLRHAVLRRGYFMKDIEVELWDRKDLYEELRYAHGRFYDYPEKVLAGWLEDITNQDMPISFFRSIIDQALREDVEALHLIPSKLENDGLQVVFIRNEVETLKFVLPEALAQSFYMFLREVFSLGQRKKKGSFIYHWFNDECDLSLYIVGKVSQFDRIEIAIEQKIK